MNIREAAQMALNAMLNFPDDISDDMFESIKALRAALAQPEREWQGLTDEEQNQVAWSCGAMSADWLDFAHEIEAKLKEKNS